MPHDVILALQVGGGALVAALGLWLLSRARRDTTEEIHLAGVGGLSSLTLSVSGLSCLALAYHAFAYAFNFTTFRAPMWIALVGALAAVLLSLLADKLENRPR
ncbi:MAG: hypothetical protein SFZ24_08605 [Planctomycetota bacterium]|nr:hypothetical protein [Planctomycetota bacterium]